VSWQLAGAYKNAAKADSIGNPLGRKAERVFAFRDGVVSPPDRAQRSAWVYARN
jgi:hypothetical protein